MDRVQTEFTAIMPHSALSGRDWETRKPLKLRISANSKVRLGLYQAIDGRPTIGHRSAPRDRIARMECQAGLHRGIGFTVELLAEMVLAGLATAQIERARAGGQTRVHITNAGRRALPLPPRRHGLACGRLDSL